MPPELARLVDVPPEGRDWVHEVKFDGYRMQLRVEKGRAVLRTRKALDWTARFPEIAAQGRGLPDCILDGEICALDENGMPSFAGLQQALSEKKTTGLVNFVFDILFLKGEDLRDLPLMERKERLAALLKSTRALSRYRYVEHFETEGEIFLKTACRANMEGIVSKRRDAPYRSGRGDLWTKAKCRGGQEVVIGGWWGGPSKIRSILVGAYRGEDFVYMGRIGTGFNAENSGPVLRALKRLVRKTSPFTAGVKPPRAKEITWVEPKLVAEVAFATMTSDGLLRQASFKALREDKPARSIVPETPAPVGKAEADAQTEVDMPASKTAKPIKGNAAVAGIAITHPDKALWPATKETPAFTKLDLARYYETIAPLMLPHIARRPISMVRAPDGIAGDQRFFQRHVLAGAAAVIPIQVKGEKKPYHALDSAEGLVSLAQAAVLEIHPWGCKPDDPETPERLIFDLDPAPELAFANVVAGAKELREVLSLCGFTPFVKTTGGKGLHVVVAIKGSTKKPPTWPEAKEFCRLLAERVAQAAPDRYVTNMSKKLRVGKIFIDYLRNDRSATAIAPYSPRARPGATIAVPLSWKDVHASLEPASYTLRSAAKLVKRSDPWKDLAASAALLEAARAKLAKAV